MAEDVQDDPRLGAGSDRFGFAHTLVDEGDLHVQLSAAEAARFPEISEGTMRADGPLSVATGSVRQLLRAVSENLAAVRHRS
jgi:hypothetical protein